MLGRRREAGVDKVTIKRDGRKIEAKVKLRIPTTRSELKEVDPELLTLIPNHPMVEVVKFSKEQSPPVAYKVRFFASDIVEKTKATFDALLRFSEVDIKPGPSGENLDLFAIFVTEVSKHSLWNLVEFQRALAWIEAEPIERDWIEEASARHREQQEAAKAQGDFLDDEEGEEETEDDESE